MGLDIYWYEKAKDESLKNLKCIKRFRKVNFIVEYFNLDNCVPYICSKEDIDVLNEKCKIVLKEKNDNVSKEELPTTTGFFFGGTEFDKWYYHDVKEVLDFTDHLLNTIDFCKREIHVLAYW